METVHSTSSTLYKHTVARWTINNFFDHVNRKTKQLNSDVFSLDGLLTQFFLRIHLLARTNNRLEYFLFVDNMAGERSIQIKYKFWLENSNGGKCAETIAKTMFCSYNQQHDGFPNFLNQDQLHSKAAFLGDGPVVVCCEITREFAVNGPEPPNADKELRQNLWKAYQSGLMDSATIQVEGKDFKISKTVLCANSPVFKSMFFMSSCKEAQTGIVKLSDTKAVAVEYLIEYMHRGEVANLEPVAVDLFKLSHKYDVKPLIELCAKTIRKMMSSEKLFEIIVMAYEYDLEELKESVLDFLEDNPTKGYFTTLTMSKEWLAFMVENTQLAHEIMGDIYAKVNFKY